MIKITGKKIIEFHNSLLTMKNLFILLFTSAITFQFLFGHFEKIEQKIDDTDSLSTVSISFVGDLMCHIPQMDYARTGKDSFDFKPVFREVKKYLSLADVTVGNLETTIAGKENYYSGYPLFNSPDEYLNALKDAGFDILLTANNHSIDRGKRGVVRTIEKIHNLGMTSIGSYKSQHDRDSTRIFDVKGIKIVLLAYTYGLNGNYISKKEKYLVNVIDTNIIRFDIGNAREKKADVVLVYLHFGEEYQRKPNSYQNEIVKCVINYGADIIIGSHPHVLQPLEFFYSSKNKIGRGLTAYSLGNFISNQRWRYSDSGAILNISLSKSSFTGDVMISDVSVFPTWVFKGKVEDKNEFVILPSDTIASKLPNYLTKTDREKIVQSFNDAQKMFNAIPKLSK